MISRPLIHIGMPKCASTWLQKQFFHPKHGFRSASDPFTTFFDFVHPPSFQWQVDPDKFDFDNPTRLVPLISFETLAGNPLTGGDDGERILYRLQRTFPDARILIVIREQQTMLRSLYKLLINYGYPYPIQTIMSNDLAGDVPTFDLAYLYYHHLIHAYQEAFGRESVLVLPYEGFVTDSNGFLELIQSFCEIDTHDFPLQVSAVTRINTNRSLCQLEFKRMYNRYIAQTKFSVGGLSRPTSTSGKGRLPVAGPEFLERWLDARFTKKVHTMTAGLYKESNAITQDLSGLCLGEHGYQLP